MSDEQRKPFLSRWSQRKLEAARESAARAATPPVAPAVVPAPVSATAPAAVPAEPPVVELPPIESLSFDSDFTAFMQPTVDEALKRQALRKLVRDPRFNVMDGLDVYIDDYTKFEPITPAIVAQLNHAKFLFDPPKTRINAQGHAEDVPVEAAEEALEAERAEAPPAQLADESSRIRVDEAVPLEPSTQPADAAPSPKHDA